MQFLKSAFEGLRFGSLLMRNEARSILPSIQQRNLSLTSQVFKQKKNPNNDGIINIPPHLRFPPKPFQRLVREHFPVPHEVKRIRRHGLDRRLTTHGGRKVIVNRIVKGKHVLAHGW